MVTWSGTAPAAVGMGAVFLERQFDGGNICYFFDLFHSPIVSALLCTGHCSKHLAHLILLTIP